MPNPPGPPERSVSTSHRTAPVRRILRLTLLTLLFGGTALPAQRTVSGQRLRSEAWPAATLVLDSSLTYLGTQSFPLYGVAHAEQHFFAERSGTTVRRLVWIQFEGYNPDNRQRYDYSADSIIQLWGKPIHHSGDLLTTPVKERRPDSDGARFRSFVRDHGLTLPPGMLYHRLVWVLEPDARNELMIIYLEDPAIYGTTAAALTAEQAQQDRLPGLLRLSLERAGSALRIEGR